MDPQNKLPLSNEPSDTSDNDISTSAGSTSPQSMSSGDGFGNGSANPSSTETEFSRPEMTPSASPPTAPTAPAPLTPPVESTSWGGPAASGVISPTGVAAPAPAPPSMPADANDYAPLPPPPPGVPGMPTVGGPRSGKKRMIIGIVVALLVVLLGASAAAYYVVTNKPQNVLNMALVNTFSKDKMKSAAFDGSLSVKSSATGPTIGATFNGASNQDGAFTVTSKIDALVTTITLDARSTDGKTFYLRVGGLAGLPQLLGGSDSAMAQVYGPMIAGINNQWIQINQSMIEQLTGSKDVSTDLSDADLKKLSDAYKKNQFLVVKQAMKDEKIKGKASHHYKIVADKTKLKGFIGVVKAANIPSMKLTQGEVDNFNKSIDETNLSKYPIDVWVGKSDKLIDQVAFSTTSDGSTVSMRLTLSDFDKPVHVTAPSGAKSLLDVLSGLVLTGVPANGSSGTEGANPFSGISL